MIDDTDAEVRRIGHALTVHAATIAAYIRDLNVSVSREKRIARNVSGIVLQALREMPRQPPESRRKKVKA